MEPSDIDRKIGRNPGQSLTGIRRARQKARKAEPKIRELEQTVELIGGEDDAE